MKNKFVVIMILIISVSSVWSQRRSRGYGGYHGSRSSGSTGSLILTMGPSFCQDDGYASDYSVFFYQGHNYHLGIGFQQPFESSNWGYRTQIQYYNFTGGDTPTHKHGMGMQSYTANVFEFSGRADYTHVLGGRYQRYRPHSIYGFAGIGTLISSAKQLPVENYTIMRMSKTTPTLAFFIPIGFGYKYEFNSKFSLGVEGTEQIVLSDLVDAYTAKNSTKPAFTNDNITSLSMTLYYKL